MRHNIQALRALAAFPGKGIVLGVIGFLCVPLHGAAAYKCMLPDGSVTYQQTQCAIGKEKRINPVKSKSTSSESEILYAKEALDQCVSSIKLSTMFKDPDSVKARIIKSKELAPIDYEGTKILAYKTLIEVREKISMAPMMAQKFILVFMPSTIENFLDISFK